MASPSPRLPGTVVFAAALLAGCAEPPSPGMRAWTSDDGAVSLVYLAPPWTEVSAGPDRLTLRIDAEVFGVAFSDAPPTHLFSLAPAGVDTSVLDLVETIGRGGGTGSESAAGSSGAAPPWVTGGTTGGADPAPDASAALGDPFQVALLDASTLLSAHGGKVDEAVTRAGDDLPVATFQVVLAAPEAFVRGFYYPSARGVVRVVFVSIFDLRSPDVDAMVRTIDVEGRAIP